MDIIKDILRQYWLHALALLVLIFAAIRYWLLGDYFEINRLRLMIFAFGGFVAVVASEEFADWTGRYGLHASTVVLHAVLVHSPGRRYCTCLLHDGSLSPVAFRQASRRNAWI